MCRRGKTVSDRGGFDPILGVELSQDVQDVDAGGLDADHKRGGDLAVGVAAGDEAEDPMTHFLAPTGSLGGR